MYFKRWPLAALICIGSWVLLCCYLFSAGFVISLQIEDTELLLPNVHTQPPEINAIMVPAPLATAGSNPLICSEAKKTPALTWVMFMGDSNMRHTYFWWTGQRKKNRHTCMQKGVTFGLDRGDLGFGGRWADQELLVAKDCNSTSTSGGVGVVNDSIARYSFRFLHGSVNEFINSAINWDIARRQHQHPTRGCKEGGR